MPSKLSIHLSGYPDRTFDVLERIQPSIVKVFNQPSEMNIDELRRRCGAIIIYREFVDLDFHTSADVFYSRIENSLNKLRGRGIIWEGLNEPVVNSVDDAKAINAWFVRFAQIMHSEGELVAGFSWSTGNPMPDKLSQVAPYLVEAAAATDVHAFHEYYTRWIKGQDWGRYRDFEQAMPAYARKPVIITEAGLDETGQWDGGYLGRISVDEYIDILKQYDQVLLQDPYVLGATIFQWGDGSWPSFDLSPAINALSDYMLSVGRGAIIPRPWPVPIFGPARTFTATPAKIQKGQKATLYWDIEGASTVSLDGEPVSFSDSKIVEPAVTTTYVLHIVSADGTPEDLTVTLIVETSVVPIITDVSFTPTTLRAGQLLNVSIAIQNNTNDTLATQGPDPGFVYDEGDTFRTRGFPEVTGAFRVGVDFDEHSGVDHPYRWGLGAPLAPGQTATIVGSIRLKNPQSVKYWVGLVREQVEWLQDDQGMQLVTVKPAPSVAAQITQVTFTPTTLNAAQVLKVSITVQNNSEDALPTQGPDPGFVYEEGDTFYTRGFPDADGAFRVGVDFDGRTGIDHPYRWGLGVPLAPGQTATIIGSIRLKNPQAIRYWAGLARERFIWLQDNQGVQTITVRSVPNTVQIVDAVFTPVTLQSGQMLNVNLTVYNNTNQTLQTQGPAPGFAYEEGDTFYTRGFPDVNSALRVGVDFDGRTGIDHPYRWGLDAPLAPGQVATITGTIRLKTPQAINYWAGLVRERIAWLQDHVGTQKITVTM